MPQSPLTFMPQSPLTGTGQCSCTAADQPGRTGAAQAKPVPLAAGSLGRSGVRWVFELFGRISGALGGAQCQ
jgi:hypothetical protein